MKFVKGKAVMTVEDYYSNVGYLNEEGDLDVTYFHGTPDDEVSEPMDYFGVTLEEYTKFCHEMGFETADQVRDYLDSFSEDEPVVYCDDPHCSADTEASRFQKKKWVAGIHIISHDDIFWWENKEEIARVEQVLRQ